MACNDNAYRTWLSELTESTAIGRVFVVGPPKSGTTWLQSTLASHPQVAISGEGRFTWALDPAARRAIDAFNADQQRTGQPEATGVSRDDFDMLVRALIDRQLLASALATGQATPGLRYLGDKTPQHALSIDRLLALFPGARIVAIVRHPLDAAVSACFHFLNDASTPMTQRVSRFVRTTWAMHAAKIHEARARHAHSMRTVRYEDMHADAETETASLLRWLGVSHDPQTVRACVDASSFSRLSGGRDRGDEDPANFFRKGVVGDWRTHIREADGAAILDPVRPLLEAFGYDAGGVRDACPATLAAR